MDIEKEVNQFRAILSELSKDGKAKWMVVSDGDEEYQLAAISKAVESLFPDLTVIAFPKTAEKHEILDGIKEIQERIKIQIEREEVNHLRTAGKDEFSLKLGV
jgi:hypothetical protein